MVSTVWGMRVLLEGDTQLLLEDFEGPGLHVESAEGFHAHFTAFEMFVSGVGLCTASVLSTYAQQLDIPTDKLTLRLRWDMEVAPRRIGLLQMDIQWPELPESRQRAAELAAAQCPLHQTVSLPTEVLTRVFAGAQAAAQEERAQVQLQHERAHARAHSDHAHRHGHGHDHHVH